MTINSCCLNRLSSSKDVSSDAVELEGLARALRIVVDAFTADPDLEASNALDALASALHQKALSHRALAENSAVFGPSRASL
jgi:hypothetical protein